MPIQNIVLVCLIGLVIGVIASVALRGRGMLFIVNIILGIIGAALGAMFPMLIGQSLGIDVRSFEYLIRALAGAFALVMLASLFRSAKPPTL